MADGVVRPVTLMNRLHSCRGCPPRSLISSLTSGGPITSCRATRSLVLRNACTVPAGTSTVVPAGEIHRRREFQRRLVELIRANGPLRKGLTIDQAADSYSALANPETYLLLTNHHGWTPDRFQAWLADSIERILLAPAARDERKSA
jgi:hypothetical protein